MKRLACAVATTALVAQMALWIVPADATIAPCQQIPDQPSQRDHFTYHTVVSDSDGSTVSAAFNQNNYQHVIATDPGGTTQATADQSSVSGTSAYTFSESITAATLGSTTLGVAIPKNIQVGVPFTTGGVTIKLTSSSDGTASWTSRGVSYLATLSTNSNGASIYVQDSTGRSHTSAVNIESGFKWTPCNMFAVSAGALGLEAGVLGWAAAAAPWGLGLAALGPAGWAVLGVGLVLGIGAALACG